MKPLILRFARPIPRPSLARLRYDHEQQIAQIWEDGQWVSRLAAQTDVDNTKYTKVREEPTDDE